MSSYDTREQARKAMGDAGFKSAFSSPGRPELWIKGRSRMAIARRIRGADEDWVSLPYPEPATATPAQVAELAKRDGVVLQAGKYVAPEDAHPSVPPLVTENTEDPDADLL